MNYKRILKVFIVIYLLALSTYFTVPAEAKEKIMEIVEYRSPVYVIYTENRPITLSSEENYLSITHGKFYFPKFSLPRK